VVYLLFFVFLSRREHTISKRDWSSDVCSSDLFATGSVRYHAGKSLWTHLVPYLAAFMGFTVGTLLMYSDYRTIGLLVIVVFALVGVYYLILNLVRGIRVLF